MANVEGSWDCVIRTPLGEQRGTLTVVRDGDRFTGSLSGQLGNKAIAGSVERNTLVWTLPSGSTIPFDVECEATIDDDRLEGVARTKSFGAFPLSGTRMA
jgi:hypothetical protein